MSVQTTVHSAKCITCSITGNDDWVPYHTRRHIWWLCVAKFGCKFKCVVC